MENGTAERALVRSCIEQGEQHSTLRHPGRHHHRALDYTRRQV